MLAKTALLSWFCLMVSGDPAIYRSTDDSLMRLSSAGGKLVLEEGQLEPEPGYRRYKRIAKSGDYYDMKQDRLGYQLDNTVDIGYQQGPYLPNSEDPGSQLDPYLLNSASYSGQLSPQLLPQLSAQLSPQLSPKLLGGPQLSPQDLALASLYDFDSSDCFKKYLCELAGTPNHHLLSEEQALLVMMTSQLHPQDSAGFSDYQESETRRLKRSPLDLAEAERISAACAHRFQRCQTSRLDILRVYKQQKKLFCDSPLPYGL